jgi:hypothetical protein
MKAFAAHPGRLWPSLDQERLLKAALLDGEAALQGFRDWRAGVDLEADLGYPILRLLPLVYHNLLRLGVDDPLMGRLKGVYRRFWCENQKLFFDAHPAVRRLSESGIDLLMLKGAPLVLSYYHNHALRPMSDIDIAIPAEQALLALEVMRDSGWSFYAETTADSLKYFHAALCFKDGVQADIHYHLLRECVSPATDRWFWSDVEPVDFQGIPVLQLAPTALLLHTVLHGVRWNLEPPIRWIPDALAILRQRGGEVDWARLLAFSDARRLTHRLGLGLLYLAEHFAADLPASVLDHLQRYRPRLLERIANTAVLGDSDRWYKHPVSKQWVMFAEYCALAEAANPFNLAWGFSHYLRYRWRLRGRLELIPTLCKGLLRRMGPRR